MISSYHVRFLESHDGHQCHLPETKVVPSTIEEILQNSQVPTNFDNEKEDVLPDDFTQLNPHNPPPAVIPVIDTPIRHSS